MSALLTAISNSASLITLSILLGSIFLFVTGWLAPEITGLLAIEETVPNEIKGACFESREDAETFALDMVKGQSTPMIVEKVAPAGCWLQVLAVGC